LIEGRLKVPARNSRKLPRGMEERRRRGQLAYYARVRTGKQDRRMFLDVDFDEATWKLAQLKARGIPAEPRTLVRNAWAQWLELTRSDWKAKNRAGLETRFMLYVDPLLGRKRVVDLTADDSRRLARRLGQGKLSVRTQAHILTQWSSFARWLADTGLTAKPALPPMGEKLRPKVPDTAPDPLSEAELEKLRGIGEPYRFAVRLILATGLRWSDVVRLEAKHLKPDGAIEIVCSKTGKLLHVPVADADLVRDIRRRIGRLVPFSENSVGSFNRTVKLGSGVERFNTYRLKDTFACRWLDAGGSLVDLQHVLGHSDPRTTLRYGRPSDRRLASEGQRIGSAWHPTPKTVTETGTT
jgi:integrase